MTTLSLKEAAWSREKLVVGIKSLKPVFSDLTVVSLLLADDCVQVHYMYYRGLDLLAQERVDESSDCSQLLHELLSFVDGLSVLSRQQSSSTPQIDRYAFEQLFGEQLHFCLPSMRVKDLKVSRQAFKMSSHLPVWYFAEAPSDEEYLVYVADVLHYFTGKEVNRRVLLISSMSDELIAERLCDVLNMTLEEMPSQHFTSLVVKDSQALMKASEKSRDHLMRTLFRYYCGYLFFFCEQLVEPLMDAANKIKPEGRERVIFFMSNFRTPTFEAFQKMFGSVFSSPRNELKNAIKALIIADKKTTALVFRQFVSNSMQRLTKLPASNDPQSVLDKLMSRKAQQTLTIEAIKLMTIKIKEKHAKKSLVVDPESFSEQLIELSGCSRLNSHYFELGSQVSCLLNQQPKALYLYYWDLLDKSSAVERIVLFESLERVEIEYLETTEQRDSFTSYKFHQAYRINEDGSNPLTHVFEFSLQPNKKILAELIFKQEPQYEIHRCCLTKSGLINAHTDQSKDEDEDAAETYRKTQNLIVEFTNYSDRSCTQSQISAHELLCTSDSQPRRYLDLNTGLNNIFAVGKKRYLLFELFMDSDSDSYDRDSSDNTSLTLTRPIEQSLQKLHTISMHLRTLKQLQWSEFFFSEGKDKGFWLLKIHGRKIIRLTIRNLSLAEAYDSENLWRRVKSNRFELLRVKYKQADDNIAVSKQLFAINI